MPLKFRETGLALSPTEIRKDCTAFSGGWAVGYIYYEAREGHGDEPHTWFWSIHGVLGKPIDMRGPRHRRVTGRHKKLFGRDLAEVADVGKPQRDGARGLKEPTPPRAISLGSIALNGSSHTRRPTSVTTSIVQPPSYLPCAALIDA
jgi:hypothetical protein